MCIIQIFIYLTIVKEFENLSVEKKTLSTALGFKPRSFDCRSTALTTELHRRPTSPSPQEDFLISPTFYFRALVIKPEALRLQGKNFTRLATGTSKVIYGRSICWRLNFLNAKNCFF